MKSVCIFCGSSFGNSDMFADGARNVADTALAIGGKVVGVMPKSLLQYEIAHEGLSEFHITADISSRKAKMADLAEGFIALPGGLGTLEEFSEAISAAQLGLHSKPCGLLDVNGYFQSLLSFLDQGVESGFIGSAGRAKVVSDTDPERLIEKLFGEL